jgi:photosystem II stability/assembly factor-like uncharacterized protein
VYAGTVNGGLLRTTDRGANWSDLSGGLGQTVLITAVVVGSDGTAYLSSRNGLYTLPQGANGWLSLGFFSMFPNALAIGPGAVPPLYIAFGLVPFDFGGVARWDGASAFMRSEAAALTIISLAADPGVPGRALAATSGGAFETRDGGATWGSVNLGGASLPTMLLFDGRSPGTVYLSGTGGVRKSTDGGESWTSASNGLPVGVSWSLVATPGTTEGLFVGTTTGLYKTLDGGASWTAASSDLSGRLVNVLAADPASAVTLWAGTDDGAYRSADSGQTWSRTAAAVSGIVRAILVSADGSGRVLAGTDSGLFTSTNGGATWTPVAGGLPVAPANALVEDPSGATIYVGTRVGVFQSSDGAATWASAGDGLTNPNVLSLALLSNGTLLAGTAGGSIFARAAPSNRDPVSRPEDRPHPRTVAPRS